MSCPQRYDRKPLSVVDLPLPAGINALYRNPEFPLGFAFCWTWVVGRLSGGLAGLNMTNLLYWHMWTRTDEQKLVTIETITGASSVRRVFWKGLH